MVGRLVALALFLAAATTPAHATRPRPAFVSFDDWCAAKVGAGWAGSVRRADGRPRCVKPASDGSGYEQRLIEDSEICAPNYRFAWTDKATLRFQCLAPVAEGAGETASAPGASAPQLSGRNLPSKEALPGAPVGDEGQVVELDPWCVGRFGAGWTGAVRRADSNPLCSKRLDNTAGYELQIVSKSDICPDQFEWADQAAHRIRCSIAAPVEATSLSDKNTQCGARYGAEWFYTEAFDGTPLCTQKTTGGLMHRAFEPGGQVPGATAMTQSALGTSGSTGGMGAETPGFHPAPAESEIPQGEPAKEAAAVSAPADEPTQAERNAAAGERNGEEVLPGSADKCFGLSDYGKLQAKGNRESASATEPCKEANATPSETEEDTLAKTDTSSSLGNTSNVPSPDADPSVTQAVSLPPTTPVRDFLPVEGNWILDYSGLPRGPAEAYVMLGRGLWYGDINSELRGTDNSYVPPHYRLVRTIGDDLEWERFGIFRDRSSGNPRWPYHEDRFYLQGDESLGLPSGALGFDRLGRGGPTYFNEDFPELTSPVVENQGLARLAEYWWPTGDDTLAGRLYFWPAGGPYDQPEPSVVGEITGRRAVARIDQVTVFPQGFGQDVFYDWWFWARMIPELRSYFSEAIRKEDERYVATTGQSYKKSPLDRILNAAPDAKDWVDAILKRPTVNAELDGDPVTLELRDLEWNKATREQYPVLNWKRIWVWLRGENLWGYRRVRVEPSSGIGLVLLVVCPGQDYLAAEFSRDVRALLPCNPGRDTASLIIQITATEETRSGLRTLFIDDTPIHLDLQLGTPPLEQPELLFVTKSDRGEDDAAFVPIDAVPPNQIFWIEARFPSGQEEEEPAVTLDWSGKSIPVSLTQLAEGATENGEIVYRSGPLVIEQPTEQ